MSSNRSQRRATAPASVRGFVSRARLTSRRHRFDNESGFLTIWILGLCFCILGIGGISLDLWHGFTERRELAAITDAAAVAGASQIDIPAFQRDSDEYRDGTTPVALNGPQARAAAIAYLDQQAAEKGFSYTTRDAQVVGNEIRVTATRTLDLTLLQLLRPGETMDVRTFSAASPGLST